MSKTAKPKVPYKGGRTRKGSRSRNPRTGSPSRAILNERTKAVELVERIAQLEKKVSKINKALILYLQQDAGDVEVERGNLEKGRPSLSEFDESKA